MTIKGAVLFALYVVLVIALCYGVLVMTLNILNGR